MSIWDELYSGYVRAELKAESDGVETFKSVDAKVQDLRRRVGLHATIDFSKKASLDKSASKSFRLVLAAEVEPAEDEDALIAVKGYLMQLLDMRRAGIQADVAIADAKSKFSQYEQLINNHKAELREFIEKYQQKFRTAPLVPAPTPNTIKIDPTEDGATFENSAEKLKM